MGGDDPTNKIIYKIESIDQTSNYAVCRQQQQQQQSQSQSSSSPFPTVIHLQANQLEHVQPFNGSVAATAVSVEVKEEEQEEEEAANAIALSTTPMTSAIEIGFQFSMRDLCFEITRIHQRTNICECKQIVDPDPQFESELNDEFPAVIYLAMNQMQYVSPIVIGASRTTSAPPPPIKTADDDDEDGSIQNYGSMQTFVLSDDVEQDVESLANILPYFSEFKQRKEKSVLSMNSYKNDPQAYLQVNSKTKKNSKKNT